MCKLSIHLLQGASFKDEAQKLFIKFSLRNNLNSKNKECVLLQLVCYLKSVFISIKKIFGPIPNTQFCVEVFWA